MPGTVAAERLRSFDEDLRTAWVPDALGQVDAELLIQSDVGATEAIEILDVPKPDGSLLRAPVLNYQLLGALHRATEGCRDTADHVLSPGVCGYRRGAEPARAYQDEYRRLREMTEAEGEGARVLVTADVSEFFRSATWPVVLRQLERLVDSSTSQALGEIARTLSSRGLDHLPAGYADARLLANLALHQADLALDAPFTRWVDDYRIFCQSEAEGNRQLELLSDAMATIGLKLNTRKVAIREIRSGRSILGESMQSVYHPDIEGPDQVRASLRSVFVRAAAEPRAHRRALRFVLPRLAMEGDNIAVDWCLQALPSIPWEAPRVAAYLSNFLDDPSVGRRIRGQMQEAIQNRQLFVAARLIALSMRAPEALSPELATWITARLSYEESATIWGLLVRHLAVSGVPGAVEAAARDPRDSRVLAGSLLEVQRAIPTVVANECQATLQAAMRVEAIPLPILDSIL